MSEAGQRIVDGPAVVVAGDIVIDRHLYEGRRSRPRMTADPGVTEHAETGGAALLCRLIQAALAETAWRAELGVRLAQGASGIQHAMALWSPLPDRHGSPRLVWRASKLLGYGGGGSPREARLDPTAAGHAALLVLDDAGSEFRKERQRPCWQLPEAGSEGWVLLKTTDPVARGDLWPALAAWAQGERERGTLGDRFVCLVSAQDLRREAVTLRHGVSWERTVDDVRDALLGHPILKQLEHCPHLVITFWADGALWIDRTGEAPRATLVFEPGGVEGGFVEGQQGTVVGSMMAMTAALARSIASWIAEPGEQDGGFSLLAGIKTGLGAMRDLHLHGHGPAEDAGGRQLGASGYPVGRIGEVIRAPAQDSLKPFADSAVPWPESGVPVQPSWTIAASLRQVPGFPPAMPTLGLARSLVTRRDAVLSTIPHARFGDLVTVDRQEIEALRAINRLMRAYVDAPADKPLSIGVFGPPGAGKSFGVKQLVKAFDKVTWLEFNLSQFTDQADLRGAFHSSRDAALSGRTPVVFWDEFDAENFKWLRHLLAPMQDGRFQDGQLNHAIGKAVFIFAGGTSARYADFGRGTVKGGAAELVEQERAFALLKGPDFRSRIDAYYDVAGPNQREIVEGGTLRADGTDDMYPMRRALLIRTHLKLAGQDPVDFDPDLLDALLLVPKYLHGSRSLEKLVKPLRPAEGRSVRRSALPSLEQLAMYVAPAAFASILGRLREYRRDEPAIEALAEMIYEGWAAGEREMGKAPVAYGELGVVDRQVNRAAARRIPEVLALVGLTVAPREGGHSALARKQVEALIEQNMERLAEEEHDGWVGHRSGEGWTFDASRMEEARLHPMMVPYKELPDENKRKDRANVGAIWSRLDRAEYDVVWLTPEQAIAAGAGNFAPERQDRPAGDDSTRRPGHR